MKYNILGFSQEKAIEMNIDLTDLLLVRWFVDFKDTGAMERTTIDGVTYYWVNYKNLLEQIPIIGINSKDVLRRRLKKLEEKGILIHTTVKQGGTFSYYALGDKYAELTYTAEVEAKATEANADKQEAVESKKAQPKNDSKVVSFKPTQKVSKFNQMYSHDFDLEELEALQQKHIHEKVKELELTGRGKQIVEQAKANSKAVDVDEVDSEWQGISQLMFSDVK